MYDPQIKITKTWRGRQLHNLSEHTVTTLSGRWLLPRSIPSLSLLRSRTLCTLATSSSLCHQCVLLHSAWNSSASHVLCKSEWRENREGDVMWTNTLWMKPFPNGMCLLIRRIKYTFIRRNCLPDVRTKKLNLWHF